VVFNLKIKDSWIEPIDPAGFSEVTFIRLIENPPEFRLTRQLQKRARANRSSRLRMAVD
jgi:hypothetical protein